MPKLNEPAGQIVKYSSDYGVHLYRSVTKKAKINSLNCLIFSTEGGNSVKSVISIFFYLKLSFSGKQSILRQDVGIKSILKSNCFEIFGKKRITTQPQTRFLGYFQIIFSI